jgi:hypothetical protein
MQRQGNRLARTRDDASLSFLIRLSSVVSVLSVVSVFPLYAATPPAPERQTVEEAQAKSKGCVTCHTTTDRHTMHQNPGVVLGCTDCHGGEAKIAKPPQAERPSVAYLAALRRAHVLPRDEKAWKWPSSATPERTYTLLNRESAEFVRFINPGDLRVAREACGACHLPIIQASERSLMATSAMLWGGAAYNNGILPFKRYILGRGVHVRRDGPASIVNPVAPDTFMTQKGILPSLAPMPAWETIPPADVFRVFERGGRVIGSQFPEVGLPNNTGALQKLDEPGRPDFRQSNRGPATGSRIAVPSSTSPRRASTIRTCGSWARTSRRATTGLRAAARAMRSMRTTATRSIRASTRVSATAGRRPPPTPPSRRPRRDTRSATSSRARSRRRSAWSATCTTERVREQLLRHDHVGLRV